MEPPSPTNSSICSSFCHSHQSLPLLLPLLPEGGAVQWVRIPARDRWEGSGGGGGEENYGIRWSLGKPHAIQASPSLGRGREEGPSPPLMPLQLRALAWQAQPWEGQGGSWTMSPGQYLPVLQAAQAVPANRCFQALPVAKKRCK